MHVDQLPRLCGNSICAPSPFAGGVSLVCPPRRSCVLRPASVCARASFAMLQTKHAGLARRISLETFSKKGFAAAGTRAKRPLDGRWQCRRALATAGGLAGALLFSEAVVRMPEDAERGIAASPPAWRGAIRTRGEDWQKRTATRAFRNGPTPLPAARSSSALAGHRRMAGGSRRSPPPCATQRCPPQARICRDDAARGSAL